MNEFNTNVPIYIQVMNNIKMKIMNGTLKVGDKFVSIRELALELSVNPKLIHECFD